MTKRTWQSIHGHVRVPFSTVTLTLSLVCNLIQAHVILLGVENYFFWSRNTLYCSLREIFKRVCMCTKIQCANIFIAVSLYENLSRAKYFRIMMLHDTYSSAQPNVSSLGSVYAEMEKGTYWECPITMSASRLSIGKSKWAVALIQVFNRLGCLEQRQAVYVWDIMT